MINKQGIVNFNETAEFLVNEFDLENYRESDGSIWIRVFHHNNPSGGLFASTDDFTKPIYKDVNRWFNCQLFNQIADNKWELMVKQKKTSSDTETKYRWIQTKNPYNAVYADVSASNITRITTSGYTNISTAGGLYKHNASTYFVINNGTSGNWFGAIGSWTVYQNGIPAYPTTGVITSGYMDLYLRLDTSNIVNEAIIGKNYIRAKQLIEE